MVQTEPEVLLELNDLVTNVAMTALATELSFQPDEKVEAFLGLLERTLVFGTVSLLGNDGHHELVTVEPSEGGDRLSVTPYLQLLLNASVRFRARISELEYIHKRTIFDLPIHVVGAVEALWREVTPAPLAADDKSELPSELRHYLSIPSDRITIDYWNRNYWLAFYFYILTSQVATTIISSRKSTTSAAAQS